jgi:hypothetical protein
MGWATTSAVVGTAATDAVVTMAELAMYGSLGFAGVGLCIVGFGII